MIMTLMVLGSDTHDDASAAMVIMTMIVIMAEEAKPT